METAPRSPYTQKRLPASLAPKRVYSEEKKPREPRESKDKLHFEGNSLYEDATTGRILKNTNPTVVQSGQNQNFDSQLTQRKPRGMSPLQKTPFRNTEELSHPPRAEVPRSARIEYPVEQMVNQGKVSKNADLGSPKRPPRPNPLMDPLRFDQNGPPRPRAESNLKELAKEINAKLTSAGMSENSVGGISRPRIKDQNDQMANLEVPEKNQQLLDSTTTQGGHSMSNTVMMPQNQPADINSSNTTLKNKPRLPRSRSYDRQKHIFAYPSFEPPVYILDGETIEEYNERTRTALTEDRRDKPRPLIFDQNDVPLDSIRRPLFLDEQSRIMALSKMAEVPDEDESTTTLPSRPSPFESPPKVSEPGKRGGEFFNIHPTNQRNTPLRMTPQFAEGSYPNEVPVPRIKIVDPSPNGPELNPQITPAHRLTLAGEKFSPPSPENDRPSVVSTATEVMTPMGHFSAPQNQPGPGNQANYPSPSPIVIRSNSRDNNLTQHLRGSRDIPFSLPQPQQHKEQLPQPQIQMTSELSRPQENFQNINDYHPDFTQRGDYPQQMSPRPETPSSQTNFPMSVTNQPVQGPIRISANTPSQHSALPSPPPIFFNTPNSLPIGQPSTVIPSSPTYSPASPQVNLPANYNPIQIFSNTATVANPPKQSQPEQQPRYAQPLQDANPTTLQNNLIPGPSPGSNPQPSNILFIPQPQAQPVHTLTTTTEQVQMHNQIYQKEQNPWDDSRRPRESDTTRNKIAAFVDKIAKIEAELQAERHKKEGLIQELLSAGYSSPFEPRKVLITPKEVLTREGADQERARLEPSLLAKEFEIQNLQNRLVQAENHITRLQAEIDRLNFENSRLREDLTRGKGAASIEESQHLARVNSENNKLKAALSEAEVESRRLRDSLHATEASYRSQQDNDRARLAFLESETLKTRAIEAELSRLRSVELEFVNVKRILPDYARLKGLEQEFSRLKSIEIEFIRLKNASAYQFDEVSQKGPSLEDMERNLGRITQLERENAQLRQQLPTLGQSLAGSVTLSQVYSGLKGDLTSLHSLSNLILLRMNTMISSPPNPGAEVFGELHASQRSIMDKLKNLEGRLSDGYRVEELRREREGLESVINTLRSKLEHSRREFLDEASRGSRRGFEVLSGQWGGQVNDSQGTVKKEGRDSNSPTIMFGSMASEEPHKHNFGQPHPKNDGLHSTEKQQAISMLNAVGEDNDESSHQDTVKDEKPSQGNARNNKPKEQHKENAVAQASANPIKPKFVTTTRVDEEDSGRASPPDTPGRFNPTFIDDTLTQRVSIEEVERLKAQIVLLESEKKVLQAKNEASENKLIELASSPALKPSLTINLEGMHYAPEKTAPTTSTTQNPHKFTPESPSINFEPLSLRHYKQKDHQIQEASKYVFRMEKRDRESDGASDGVNLNSGAQTPSIPAPASYNGHSGAPSKPAELPSAFSFDHGDEMISALAAYLSGVEVPKSEDKKEEVFVMPKHRTGRVYGSINPNLTKKVQDDTSIAKPFENSTENDPDNQRSAMFGQNLSFLPEAKSKVSADEGIYNEATNQDISPKIFGSNLKKPPQQPGILVRAASNPIFDDPVGGVKVMFGSNLASAPITLPAPLLNTERDANSSNKNSAVGTEKDGQYAALVGTYGLPIPASGASTPHKSTPSALIALLVQKEREIEALRKALAELERKLETVLKENSQLKSDSSVRDDEKSRLIRLVTDDEAQIAQLENRLRRIVGEIQRVEEGKDENYPESRDEVRIKSTPQMKLRKQRYDTETEGLEDYDEQTVHANSNRTHSKMARQPQEQNLDFTQKQLKYNSARESREDDIQKTLPTLKTGVKGRQAVDSESKTLSNQDKLGVSQTSQASTIEDYQKLTVDQLKAKLIDLRNQKDEIASIFRELIKSSKADRLRLLSRLGLISEMTSSYHKTLKKISPPQVINYHQEENADENRETQYEDNHEYPQEEDEEEPYEDEEGQYYGETNNLDECPDEYQEEVYQEN